MYRLVLYELILLICLAVILSVLHILPYDPLAIIFSTLFLVFFCGFINEVFARVFEAPTNIESAYISALILALIITPVSSLHDFIFLGWAAVLAMSSKYILAIGKKHIFNPVAVAVALTAFGINESASWWVGNLSMMPLVIIGGVLIARKIRRGDLIYSFLFGVFVVVIAVTLLNGSSIYSVMQKVLFHSSLFFFAFILLTEPLTTPPTKSLQIVYGLITGLLFMPQVHLGSIYSTPELALLVGNVFSYLVSPKQKLLLRLKEKIKVSPDTFDFVFSLSKKLTFTPGQYLEWTLSHPKTDSRGNRRYFTIASSPTEDSLRIGAKFYEHSSSFKTALLNLSPEKTIVASQLAGDFTLSKNPSEKYVLIAGGIGITPFRSIIKYLVDTNQKRDIVLFYANKNEAEIVYKDVFDEAVEKIGTKVIYTLTDITQITPDWMGKKGRIDAEMIRAEVSDFSERIFYLSGPHGMVTAYEQVLKKLGIRSNRVKTDYFPGFV